jgi:4-hydroxybenzoate polyprenyltransferase
MKFLSLSNILRLSRPRFWIYVLGPYIVGLAAGADSLQSFGAWPVMVWALYFTLPANLLIYGVNDIFDYETDRDNAKKVEYETLVPPDERGALWKAIGVTNGPFVLALPFMPVAALAGLGCFLFLSLFYSATPIRAKARPIIDSAFNVLYVFPAVFGYFLVGGKSFYPALFFAAWLWAMAMHAYSAVPDIEADKKNGLATVATVLGFYGTLVFCAVCYAAAAMIAFPLLGRLAALLGLVYVGLMFLSIKSGPEEIFRRYKWFPGINTACGFCLFWAVVFHRFYDVPRW